MVSILRRVPNSNFSEVVRGWERETAVILGCGPSLTYYDVRKVEKWHDLGLGRCVAVNDAYLLAPFADVLYFADYRWWLWHVEGLDKPRLKLSAHQVRQSLDQFSGERCSMQSAARRVYDDRVHYLRNRDFPQHKNGLSLDPSYLVSGRNGGWQATNLAMLAGASVLALLGFDGVPARDGSTHFHDGHPAGSHPIAWSAIQASFLDAAPAVRKAGVRLLNCTPGSWIKSPDIETCTLDYALRQRGSAP